MADQLERPEIGDIVGKRFKVVETLGEGGYGCVFIAIDLKTD